MDDSVRADRRSIDWAATAKLTLARALASALVWSVLAVAFKAVPMGHIAGVFGQLLLAIAVGAPLYHGVVRGVRATLGGIPFVTLACNLLLVGTSILAAAGDPIVFALNRQFPDLIGIADFKVVNFVPAIFVHQQ